jgi:hypothetical protein
MLLRDGAGKEGCKIGVSASGQSVLCSALAAFSENVWEKSMFRKNASLAVSIVLSLCWSNAIADTNVHINNLPSEAGKIAQELIADCKDEGDATGGDLDKTIDVYDSGNGKRLAVFDPKRICAFHGNAVCSTDGCDVYIYSEQSPGLWKIALKQTVIGDFTVEEGRGSKPLQVIMNVRGGSPLCNRDRQSTCIFELTWRGAGFASKRLR